MVVATFKGLVLKDDGDDDVRLWTCSECGALVGPGATARNRHSYLHDQIETLEARVSELED